MTKDKNIYEMPNLVKEKKIKQKNTDEYVTDAPNLVAPFLEELDIRFVNMCKAIVTDDITIRERQTTLRWSPSSTKAQRFFHQSPIYRGVMDYCVQAKMLGTSSSISYMVSRLGVTYPTITKIVNEAEAEGFITVYNKGDAKEKTAIAAKAWLVIDYMKLYCVSRAEGWNAVLNEYDTNNFHLYYEVMKTDPKKVEKFAKQFDQAEKSAKKEDY